MEYYRSNDLKHIAEAKSYKELLVVALDVLEKISYSSPSKPIAMVCGPISNGGTGSRKENLRIFSQAIDRVTSGGLIVFNQMPFEDDMERIYKYDPELQGLRLLEEFYLPIFKTNLISMLLFLPGWQNSVDANWEYGQSKKLEIPTIRLAEYYISD